MTTSKLIAKSIQKEGTVELLSIGNELLTGTITDTNAQWISNKITRAGGVVKRITAVRDRTIEISHVINECIDRRPGWLIVSGGLGPTYDDKTLSGLAWALGRELVLDQRAVKMLKKSYARNKQRLAISDKRLNDARLKMARIPRGSVPIQNPVGTAPSVYIDIKKGAGSIAGRSGTTSIVCLPGVPKEMKAIFSRNIMPRIKESVGKYYFVEYMFETTGVSESMLASTLSRIVNSYPTNYIYLKTHPKGYIKKVSRNREVRSKPKLEPKLNLQIVSRGRNRTKVQERYETILSVLKKEILKLGGKIMPGTPEMKIE
jgi:nicotinamide-nucleotide amidase